MQGEAAAAEARLSELMDRLESLVRAKSIVVPQKYFEAASAKIKNGDYDFSVDVTLRDAAETGVVNPMEPRSKFQLFSAAMAAEHRNGGVGGDKLSALKEQAVS